MCRVVSYRTRKGSLRWSFFADSYLYGVSEQIQLGCPSGNLGQLFLICINARWPLIDVEVFLYSNPLVPTSSVIPLLRVVWFVESSFNVGF